MTDTLTSSYRIYHSNDRLIVSLRVIAWEISIRQGSMW